MRSGREESDDAFTRLLMSSFADFVPLQELLV